MKPSKRKQKASHQAEFTVPRQQSPFQVLGGSEETWLGISAAREEQMYSTAEHLC